MILKGPWVVEALLRHSLDPVTICRMGFTTLDYAVLFTYLAATALLGSLLGRGQKDLRSYFLGGGRMPWWAISLSIVATETSTLTFIGAPAIAFAGNLTFLQLVVGYLGGRVLVSLVLLPGYFYGQIQTAYQVLRERLGRREQQVAALLFQITRMLADGVRLFATALVLSVVSQISDLWTILIIGVVTVVYTYYGGMTAVVWNDVIQLLIYLGGALAAFWILLERIPDGWNGALTVAGEANKLQWVDLSLDLAVPYTIWAGLIGGAFLTFATHGTDQMMVQRYLACGDLRKSQLALILSGIVVLVQFVLFLLLGTLLFVFYEVFPPQEPFTQVDRVLPTFIVTQMPSGVSGFIIAAVFAAAMSTLSSSLNSLASSTVNDFYRPYFRPQADQKHYLRVSRLTTLLWALVLMGISILARSWGGVLEVGLSITSFTMGCVLGIFLLGLAPPRVGRQGGLMGVAGGLLVMTLIVQFSSIAWPWYVLIGTGATVSLGWLASLLRGTHTLGA